MNIFVLDSDLSLSVFFHIDKHIVKMPLEAAQLCCTALSFSGIQEQYKPTHKNHPCSVWSRLTRKNFEYTASYGLLLCKEYTNRYGKIHSSQAVLERCIKQSGSIPHGDLTPHPLAMPDHYKTNNPVNSYRAYYIGEKHKIAKWKHGQTPPWFPKNKF